MTTITGQIRTRQLKRSEEAIIRNAEEWATENEMKELHRIKKLITNRNVSYIMNKNIIKNRIRRRKRRIGGHVSQIRLLFPQLLSLPSPCHMCYVTQPRFDRIISTIKTETELFLDKYPIRSITVDTFMFQNKNLIS